MDLASLPSLLLSANLFSLLDDAELYQLRLVNKELCAAATAALRTLRPSKSSEDLTPDRFPALQVLDFSAISADAWSEHTSLPSLSHAKDLRSLRLGQTNHITPTGASHIAEITQLRSIEVLDIQISDAALHHWSCLTNLTSLSLLGCPQLSSDAFISTLSALQKLQVVELSGCTGVDDAVLSNALCTLPELTKLDLSSCDGFTETGLAALSQASSLRTLLMPACWHIDDEMLAVLCTALPHLECLSLFEAGEGVSDVGLTKLTKLQNLTALDLGYSCWAHTAQGLETLISGLPIGLKMLNIGGAEGVNDAVVHCAVSRLTALTMLDISECQRTTADGIKMLKDLQNLKELLLGWNLRLPDSAVAALPPSLTKLDLSYCSELSLKSLGVNSLPHVVFLQARRCNMLSDAGLAAVTKAAPCLQHLDVSYCTNITSTGVKHLSSLSNLKSLTLSGCPHAATVVGLGSLAKIHTLCKLEACNNPRLDNGCMQSLSFVRHLKMLSLRGCPRITDHGILALIRMHGLEKLEIDGRGVSHSAILKLRARNARLKSVKLACKDPMSRVVDYYESLSLGVHSGPAPPDIHRFV